MTFSTRTLYIGCTAAFLSGGSAWAQEACQPYTVVAGDNLRFIARSAYGDADLYRVVYNANADIIGAKADLIEIGAVLQLPCDPNAPAVVKTASVGLQEGVVDPAAQPLEVTPALPVASTDGGDVAEPEVVETAAAAPTEEAPAEDSASASQFSVRMVTGNGYAPFSDEMLPGGGMFTQLVEMAIFRADPGIPYNLTFVNDWQAHIDALLPSGAYDISFPWVRPECDDGEMLSASDQSRCDAFEFSAPLYEVVDGYFALASSELVAATDYAAFMGKRICRPEGFTTGVLEAKGLTGGSVELMRPIAAADCFEALASGRVDLVSMDVEVGDTVIAELGLTGTFLQNPHLSTMQSLHAIAHKSNPRAVQVLRLLDEGVVEMYESGEWYDIVSNVLSTNTALRQ
jgi:ABC-type amino acid transport substrate-binding protein